METKNEPGKRPRRHKKNKTLNQLIKKTSAGKIKNIKQSNEYTLNQGTFLFSHLNLLITLKNDPILDFNIEEEFEKLYEKKEFKKSIMLNLLGTELGKKECKNYIIEQYDKNLPYHLQEKFGIKKREMPETIRTIMQENH